MPTRPQADPYAFTRQRKSHTREGTLYKCKKEKKNEGQFLYVIAVLYFILQEILLVKHFLHIYFLSFRKKKSFLKHSLA